MHHSGIELFVSVMGLIVPRLNNALPKWITYCLTLFHFRRSVTFSVLYIVSTDVFKKYSRLHILFLNEIFIMYF